MMDSQPNLDQQNYLQAWNSFYQKHLQRQNNLSIYQDYYLSKCFFQSILCQKKSEKISQIVANLQKGFQVQQKQQDSAECKVKKSVFHNFQKHLIITLKQQITKKLLLNQSKLVNSIWNIFLLSTQYNKQILCVIFKNFKQKMGKNILNSYGFSLIQQENDQKDIQQAQQILKQIILSHFRSNSIKKMLERRKLDLQQKQQLQQYINEFIAELSQGKIQRRFPKKCKSKIMLQRQ